jgi:hypothetical protein
MLETFLPCGADIFIFRLPAVNFLLVFSCIDMPFFSPEELNALHSFAARGCFVNGKRVKER